jgi:outer membrane receptor protein involved in Fe transport
MQIEVLSTKSSGEKSMNLRRKVFRSWQVLGVCALSLLLFSQMTFGQGITTGSIAGTVQDQQQQVIPGANVTAVENGTNTSFTAKTNSVGAFEIRGLPVGTYTLTIDASGFSKTQVNNVATNAGRATSLGLQTLGVASTQESVTVEASAPILQTDAMQIGESFQTKKLADLPVGNGLDIVTLFTPGVVPAGDSGFSNQGGAQFAANGQRARDNNFQLDGQSNNDTSIGGPVIFFGNQDAVAEIQVLTNYTAEYGRNTGTVVNYITKAGTNGLHGTAYEFYNGNWGDSLANQDKSPLFGICPKGVAVGTATDFASACTAPVVPRNVDNRYGGTIGGPIIKDRLWFFGSANLEPIRTGPTRATSGGQVTPTANGLAQLAAAFPNNPAVAAFKAIGPLAVTKGTLSFGPTQSIDVNGVPIDFATVNRDVDAKADDYEGSGRIDFQLTQNDKIFGRYYYQKQLFTNVAINGLAGVAAGQFIDEPSHTHQFGIDWAHTFSPTLINQARFSYSTSTVGFEDGGFPDCSRANFAKCPTFVTFQDNTLGFGEVSGFPQGRDVINYQAQDNATKQVGLHALKFGGEFQRQRQPNFFLPNSAGSFTFNCLLGQCTGANNQPIPSDFISNSPAQFVFADGPPSITFKENDGAFYLQDDWRARSNLTLTLGLRYEIASQAVNLLHDITVQRESNAATAFFDPALPLSRRTLPAIPIAKKNFAPVVGFSYSPSGGWLGNNATVIRGGFRIAYNPEFYNLFTNVAGGAPFINLGQSTACTNCLPASGNAADVRSSDLGFIPRGAGQDPGSRKQTLVAPNLHNPYSEQWNLGIQRQVGSRIVGEIRYLGNRGIGLFQDVNTNPALGTLIQKGFGNLIPSGFTPCADSTAVGFSAGYANCNQTRVLSRNNVGMSYYNAVQTRLDIQALHGVTAGLSYTYSHTIDTSSEVFNSIGGGSTLAYPQNPFNITEGERGTSGLDYPNVTSLYILYDVPFFRNGSGLVSKLLGGWQVNPTYRFTSGQPYTPVEARNLGAGTTLCDPTGTFSTANSPCRPILANSHAPVDTVGAYNNSLQLTNFFTGDPISSSAVHWILNDNNAAKVFGTPFAGVGRNTVRGDTINQVNLALLKDMKLTERFTVQLRGVAYNVMNRQYRGVPDPQIRDLDFANNQGSFGNTFFNSNGGNPPQANSVFSGIDRRRIEVGAKVIF